MLTHSHPEARAKSDIRLLVLPGPRWQSVVSRVGQGPGNGCPATARGGLDGNASVVPQTRPGGERRPAVPGRLDHPGLEWRKKTWERFYGPRKAANFGIGGDRTEHVLWRIQNGELDGHRAQGGRAHDRHQQRQRKHARRDRPGNHRHRRTSCAAAAQDQVLLLGGFPQEPKADAPFASGSSRSTRRSPSSTTARTCITSISARRS